MAKTGKPDPNYDWAEKHITDFERYLAEQCQPYFEEVAAEYLYLSGTPSAKNGLKLRIPLHMEP